MNRHNGPAANHSRKNNVQSQGTRVPIMNGMRVAPESASYDKKPSVRRIDLCQYAQQVVSLDISGQEIGAIVPVDLCPQSTDLKEVDSENSSCVTSSFEEPKGPAIRSVSMRDMGTEMTPIPSQEPSRTGTPVGATTPLRSPISSVPSTPRGAPTSTPAEYSFDCNLRSQTEKGSKELSAQELKLKTRKEIVALGVQLGKMNIAAWASKDEEHKNTSAAENTKLEELRRMEFEKRAVAWEEAKKSKQTARFKREDIKIQAWESQQKAKLDAEMRKIEAKVEKMRANAQAKMVKKAAMAKQRSEEKRNAAEAKKSSQSQKLAAQAEHIRQTGQVPSYPYMCCRRS